MKTVYRKHTVEWKLDFQGASGISYTPIGQIIFKLKKTEAGYPILTKSQTMNYMNNVDKLVYYKKHGTFPKVVDKKDSITLKLSPKDTDRLGKYYYEIILKRFDVKDTMLLKKDIVNFVEDSK